MSIIPALKGIQRNHTLYREHIDACSRTEATALRGWRSYQKLVMLIDHVHQTEDVPKELEALRDIKLRRVYRKTKGLSIGDFCQVVQMPEITRCSERNYMRLIDVGWSNADQRALIQIRDKLIDNLPVARHAA